MVTNTADLISLLKEKYEEYILLEWEKFVKMIKHAQEELLKEFKKVPKDHLTHRQMHFVDHLKGYLR